MIAPKHHEVFWIPQFIAKKQGNDFDIVLVSINVIALEQICFVRGRPYLIEKPKQILQLSMNISRYDNRRLHINYYRFLFQLRY